MSQNIEFKLIENVDIQPIRNWEKLFLILFVVCVIVYSIYFYTKTGTIHPITSLTFFMLLTRSFVYWRAMNTHLLYRISLKDGYLSVYNKNAILWKKRVKEITDVILHKEKYFYKLRIKERKLILKTSNDSFTFFLVNTKFVNFTQLEVVNKIKESVKNS